MKNLFTVFLSVILISAMLLSTAATSTPPSDNPAKYNNTISTSTNATISSSGYLKIDFKYNGISGVTTKGVITSYVEKRFLGLFWTRVNIGQPNNEWVDTSYSYTYSGSHTHQLTSTGTYRITVNYKISGSGGAADSIDYQVTRTY